MRLSVPCDVVSSGMLNAGLPTVGAFAFVYPCACVPLLEVEEPTTQNLPSRQRTQSYSPGEEGAGGGAVLGTQFLPTAFGFGMAEYTLGSVEPSTISIPKPAPYTSPSRSESDTP